MFRNIVFALFALAYVRAQIPSLGFCPEYVPMAGFDMERFIGVWYEAERYFQLSEVVSRCVMANYTRRPDGKYHVSNEVTNRFTGIKRVLEGEIRPAASKAEEGKLHVKYTTIPLTPETKYSVLETDYDNYAVLWSCSGLGPVHTQNAWIMTRQRLPAGEILQKAYGVLDKYKISKAFFVKTDQEDCAFLDTFIPVTTQKTVQASAEKNVEQREAVVPDTPNVIVSTRNVDAVPAVEKEKPVVKDKVKEVKEEKVSPKSSPLEPQSDSPALEEPEKVEHKKPEPVTVPEAILKSAEKPLKETQEKKKESIKLDEKPAKPKEEIKNEQ